ncbi:GntR family transcriptional regulator [Mesorhizobium sp. L-8-10]|uniref:FadR/GntR family transcriptional regulator n=1 Tax=Mesorhizobium sp. L-8-10 TaxID=2744523 RepID=UPI0019295490|nr:FadR/GntR family transcriptional regulator [Mesorhizobium sp. L-8-10]BCH28691.1 GntR family transcriptional regulator [Mesorhizobium sp. L-8-10]
MKPEELALDSDVQRRPKLADRLVETLRRQIASGQLSPGSKLPTEHQLSGEFGVSRTVVREAVTRLAADGLVVPRQGAGVFVNDNAPLALESLVADLSGKVSLVLNVLEVRMAIEIESAALAAQRRSPSQMAEINEAFGDFENLLQRREPTGAADFAFHRAIAQATNNPFYVEILDVLGRRTIPRDLVTSFSSGLLQSEEYQARLQSEHRAIMDAISESDPGAARDAMRRHLSASQKRYHGLLQSGGDLERLFPGKL